MSPSALWPTGTGITRALTVTTGLGIQLAGLYAVATAFGGWVCLRPLRGRRPGRGTPSGGAGEDVMLSWGLIVFVGLWLILADLKPVTKAKLMGQPFLIHFLVIGSGLAIHGGSADGAMAAIVSGICSALYVRWQQRLYGFIHHHQWHPGVLRARDPRETTP